MKYTINETAKLLNISRDTLRYYEKINLVSAKREDNNYRYYDEDDILRLKYVIVMKLNNFCLKEIQTLLELLKFYDSSCVTGIVQLVEDKKQDVENKIKALNKSLDLFDEFMTIKNNCSANKFEILDNLVIEIANRLNKGEVNG